MFAWFGRIATPTRRRTDEMTCEEFALAVGINTIVEDSFSSLTRNSTKEQPRPKLDMCLFQPLPLTNCDTTDDVRVEKKGRFTVTTQRSAHFTPKVSLNLMRVQSEDDIVGSFDSSESNICTLERSITSKS